MNPNHTYTTTSADGTKLTLHRWNEQGRENVFLLHGYVGHGNRFHALAGALAEQGYRVTALDFRGHGKSDGKRGDIDMWIRYQEDILAAVATIREPFVAIAQGSGSLALLSTMQGSITPPLKGIVLVNPLLGVLHPPSMIQKIIIRIGKQFSISRYTAHRFRWEQLAFDPSVVQSYQADPLCFTKTSLRFIQGTLCAQNSVIQHAQYYQHPLLLLLSSNDSIADPQQTLKFFHRYAGVRTQKTYNKSAHLLLEDSEKEKVFSDISEWIRTNIAFPE
ncbi:MAG: hypothetical protein CL916_04365 [Deltaproteobacteria bacterium]|nr:hypothetical protein [Deltaproteobacteria bacterium]